MIDPQDPSLGLEHILARIAVLDGWWQHDLRLAEDDWTPEKDHRYRRLFETRDHHLAGLDYDEARVGYRIGRMAARNPRHEDKDFAAVESALAAGWPDEVYPRIRPFVRLGFERARFSRTLQRSRRAAERIERRYTANG